MPQNSSTRSTRQSRARLPQSASVNATDRAYAEIKRRIDTNELRAGVVVKQHELAAMLGLSRTPVREALIRIAEEGLIEIRPRYGVLIRPFTLDEISGTCEVLMVLEAHAARRMAEQGATTEAMVALEAGQAVMEAAVATQDVAAWLEADEAFHKRLASECGNSQLSTIVHQLWDRLKRVRTSPRQHRSISPAANREHASLIRAIRQRNAQRASEIQGKHRLRGTAGMLALLSDNGIETI